MANYYSYFDDSTAGQNTRDQIDEESAIFGMGVSQDINCGIITATSYYGDGSALTGVGNTAYVVSVATTTGLLKVGTGATIESNGNAGYVGIITAQKFVGDGSGLTGITGSGSGVVIKNSGSVVGTAGTINFADNLSVSAISGAAVTITGIANTDYVVSVATTTGDLNVSGVATIGLLKVGTGATIESNGNAGYVGIITAQKFVGDGSALTGVTGVANTDYVVSIATTTGNLNVSAAATVGILTASSALYPPAYTTTQRDAATFAHGAIIYNLTTMKLNYYNGSWKVLSVD